MATITSTKRERKAIAVNWAVARPSTSQSRNSPLSRNTSGKAKTMQPDKNPATATRPGKLQGKNR